MLLVTYPHFTIVSKGREKDIIVFSCVRAPNSSAAVTTDGAIPSDDYSSGIGFLKEWQRLNVAVTRAKYALWIVGHGSTLSADEEWKGLIDYVKGLG